MRKSIDKQLSHKHSNIDECHHHTIQYIHPCHPRRHIGQKGRKRRRTAHLTRKAQCGFLHRWLSRYPEQTRGVSIVAVERGILLGCWHSKNMLDDVQRGFGI